MYVCLSFDIWTFNNRFAPWKGSYDQPRQHIKKQRLYIINKGPSSQSYGFSGSHVWMWELYHKESWTLKNWCFFLKFYFIFILYKIVLVLPNIKMNSPQVAFLLWCWGRLLRVPLDCKEIQPIHPQGNQSWIFIGRAEAEAETETPIFWPPDAKSWLIGKDPDAGKHWGQEEKRTTEEEMVRWHHQLNEHGFGWTLQVRDGQRGLVCCGSWFCKESDTTDKLNWHPLRLWLETSSSVFPFVSASQNLSASIICYGLEGVTL